MTLKVMLINQNIELEKDPLLLLPQGFGTMILVYINLTSMKMAENKLVEDWIYCHASFLLKIVCSEIHTP